MNSYNTIDLMFAGMKKFGDGSNVYAIASAG
jgi:hypothetical protein